MTRVVFLIVLLVSSVGAQPAPTTIPAPTAAITVTVTISAADALLVYAALAPPYTPVPLDDKGKPRYTTLEGAIGHQLETAKRSWIDAGKRARIEAIAADLLDLALPDQVVVENEIKKRKPKKEK